jgi:hypothetical protein
MVPTPPFRMQARRRDSLPTNTSKPDLRDESLAIRREIGLERGNDRRQYAADSLGHGFSGTNEYRRNRGDIVTPSGLID